MYVTTNSTLVWKRLADENQQSAKTMARVCVALVGVILALGVYSYSSHAKYNDLCTTIEIKSDTAKSVAARDFGHGIAESYCG